MIKHFTKISSLINSVHAIFTGEFVFVVTFSFMIRIVRKKRCKQYECKIKENIKNSIIQKYYVNQSKKNIQFFNLFL